MKVSRLPSKPKSPTYLLLDLELSGSNYCPFDIIQVQFKLEKKVMAVRRYPTISDNTDLKVLDGLLVDDHADICVLWRPCLLENRSNLVQ